MGDTKFLPTLPVPRQWPWRCWRCGRQRQAARRPACSRCHLPMERAGA